MAPCRPHERSLRNLRNLRTLAASLTIPVACGRDPAQRTPTPAAGRVETILCDRRTDGARVDTLLVSDGARGMATEVRWARSPDGCALLVVEDPVGVEAEPIPDALTYAASAARGVTIVRLDSAWDVAVDSAWHRLVVGRAYVARSRGADVVADADWSALAHTVGRSIGEARAASFAASTMTAARSVARPFVLDLDASTSGSRPAWRALPVLGGWRVRWSPGDSALLIGGGPRRAGDDEPAASWLRIDAASGHPLGAPVAAPAVPLRAGWRVAPSLDRAKPGPAIASAVRLDSTRDGRVVLAVTARDRPRVGEIPWRVVLFVTGARVSDPRAASPP